MRTSFCISPSISRLTGMSVHLLTTSAMSSSSTCSFSIRVVAFAAAAVSASRICRSSSGTRPYCSSDAFA